MSTATLDGVAAHVDAEQIADQLRLLHSRSPELHAELLDGFAGGLALLDRHVAGIPLRASERETRELQLLADAIASRLADTA